MRNNEYTATPNWFKQEPTDSQANIYLTNYYIGGSSTSGSSVLSSISLYNKYIINTYTLTVDDLIIPNTAIIAVDSELPEGQERPEEFVSEIGNLVSAENWYTSYSIRVLSGTTIKANLKANTSRYGIVFYDKYNTPISGYTPSEDKLIEILVPDSANYFRCCHYINSNAGSDSFYIEYQSVDKYNDDLLNEAYSGTFEDFTSIDNDIQEGIIKDTINNTLLKLIFQQPLQFTTDKIGNIKVELNNDILKDTLLSNDYVTTIENNPQDILSLKDFRQGLKINGIEIVEKNGFILIKGNLATTGGITAYTEDPDDPGSGGNPSGGGTIDSISISGTGNAFTSAELSTDKKSIIFIKGETFATQNWITNQNYITSSLLNNYVTLNTDQEISGIKDFINGIKLNNQLIKIENGILYLDCSVAVTGGLTVYAKGEQTIPDIWEGAPFDNVTIHYNPTTKIIEVLGATGSNFDEEAMWTALSSSDSSKLINASHLSNALSNYATQSWVQSQGYATQSALNSVSNKLNDFLEGSDTDVIINKWKELEAFLSGMTESDNLAEILSTKADKSFVTSELTKYVTLATEQDITAIKHFTQGLSVGSGKHKLYEENGVIYLDGDLAVKGGITTYAVSDSEVSTVMDGVVVDGTTIKKENGVLVVIGGSGSSFDKSAMWAALLASTTEQINKSHLATALSGYATESWVTNKNYAVKSTTLAGYGITDVYTKTESDSKYPTKTGSGASGTWGINITGNAGSSTKLQTARTIWGQNFDGSENINGDMTEVGSISADGEIITTSSNAFRVVYGKYGFFIRQDGADSYFLLTNLDNAYGSYNSLRPLTINNSTGNVSVGNDTLVVKHGGNVGVGIVSPLYKLHVNGSTYSTDLYINGIHLYKSADGTIKIDGNLLVTGGITAYSTGEEGGGSSGGLDVDLLWEILGGTGTQQINKSHLTDALNGYATITEVDNKYVLKTSYTAADVLTKLKSVDGSGSGLDADLLDGRNYNQFLYDHGQNYGSSDDIRNISPWTYFSGRDMINAPVTSWFSGIVMAANSNPNYKAILGFDEGGILYAGGSRNGAWRAWQQVAYTNSNVASATRLQTPRTLWGRSFDGTANVSGDMTGVGSISASGDIVLSQNGATGIRQIRIQCGDNDYGRIAAGATAANAGWLEIASADDGNEPIYVRQYTGTFTTLKRAATLLDGNGNTSFPGTVTAPTFNGNATNADKLDGIHASGLFTALSSNTTTNLSITIGGTNKTIADLYATQAVNSDTVDGYHAGSNGQNPYGRIPVVGNDGVMEVGRYLDFHHTSNTSDYNIRLQTNTASTGITLNLPTASGTLARTADNVESATKLQTPRTIWGKSFDGTNNVSGDLINVNNIYASGLFKAGSTTYGSTGIELYGTFPLIDFHQNNSTADYTSRIIAEDNNIMNINYVMYIGLYSNVGIGTNSPSQKLHVVGNILATGGITCYTSDVRAKTIIEELNLSLKQISESPTIRFKWNGWNIPDDNKTHIGGIAQYVQKLLPECILDADGVLNMDYATTAYVYSVLTARHLQTYETKTDKEIRNLKNRIKLLEKLLKKLSYEEINTVVN